MPLGPEAVTDELSRRLSEVEGRLEHLDSQIEEHPPGIPRITQLETEYQRAITDAEVSWLSSVIPDLKSGKLACDEQLAARASDDYHQAESLSPVRPPAQEPRVRRRMPWSRL